MIFYKRHTAVTRLTAGGFTLVEAVVAVSLIATGVAATVGALTKFNAVAAISRNGTGACALLQNQVDLFQSMSPFNPQPSKNQVPKDTANTPPTYDMNVTGTTPRVLGYKDSTANVPVSTEWPVYREPARWRYDNAADRTGASGFITSDIGQLAYQTDSQTYWRLDSTAPSWTQDTTNGLIVKGTMTTLVSDISTVAMPNTYKALFTVTYTYLSRTYSLSMSAIRTSDI